MSARLGLGLLIACGLASGCYGTIDYRSRPPERPLVPAGTALDTLERKLLSAPGVTFRFAVESHGPVPASLTGAFAAAQGNRVRLDASGTLEGKPAKPTLVSDGKRAEGGSLDKVFAADAPAALEEAAVLGFTRMGLLHNLAALSRGSMPDGADGSIRTFVTVADLLPGPGEVVRGLPASRYDFKMIVDGKPRGEASLWLDSRTGLPLKRHTTVHFADGDLQVDETYDDFNVSQPVDAAAFDAGPAPMEI